jgi:hypothetical protein
MTHLVDNVKRCFKEWNEQREALEAIKALVCGDAEPRWPNEPRVTAMRMQIADLCDSVALRR